MGAVDLANPQTLNMYAYCVNDPVNRMDPDGRFPFGSFFSFVGNFFLGLFQNLRPHQINGSLALGSLPPLSVSFTSNLQNVSAGVGNIQIMLRSQGANQFGALTDAPNDALANAYWELFGRLDAGLMDLFGLQGASVEISRHIQNNCF
jgi:hypothetical protein